MSFRLKFTTISLLVLSLLLVPLLGACGSKSPAASKPLSIAVTVDYSGPASEMQAPIANGYVDYFKSVNEKGGINGVKVDAQWYDTKYQLDLTKSTYDRIKSNILMFYCIYSSVATAWKDIAPADKMPCLFGCSPGSAVLPVNEWTYFCSPMYQELIAGGLLALKAKWTEPRPMRVGSMVLDNAMGQGTALGLSKWCKDNGMEYVGEQAFPLTVTEVTAQVIKLLEGKPDVMTILSLSASGSIVIRDARAAGFKGTFLGHDAMSPRDLLDILGPKLAEGVITINEYNQPCANWTPEGHKLGNELWKANRSGRVVGDYFKGIGEGMIMGEALRLAMEKVPADKLTPPDVKQYGFDRIKDFETGELKPKITYTPTDHRGGHSGFMMAVKNGEVIMVDPLLKCPDLTNYVLQK